MYKIVLKQDDTVLEHFWRILRKNGVFAEDIRWKIDVGSVGLRVEKKRY